MLVDTHCHLFMDPLFRDVEGVLERAAEAGVGKVVVPAYDRASWDMVADLSNFDAVFPALGLHPWKADEGLDPLALRDLLESTGSVAIGEIGLDSRVGEPSMDLQMEVFVRQLELALEMDLPVILHCRGAFEEMASVLGSGRFGGRLRGVMHAFSRGPELAGRFLDLGLHLAFGGAVTRPRAGRARRSAAGVPQDRILLETDAPSIGMEGLEPDEVEPAHVRRVAESLASLRDVTTDELASVTTGNAERLFGIGPG
ncbi:MAG: hypothetical protein AVO35_07890 [Candidatus Aegiribacteria sp. MLS_C]|nr:MAG: hypothetical protein AVO35_07890 [Candidatus Aegiribacteria sp. MLS_C]